MKPYRVLTDEEWLTVAPLLPELQPRKETRGRPLTNTREVLNGVLWVMHSGSSWSMLPRRFPSYQTCHRRFKAWQRTGVLKHVLTELFGAAGDEFHTAIVARMRNPQPAVAPVRGRPGEGPGSGTDNVWDAVPLQNAFTPMGSRTQLMAAEPAAPAYLREQGAHAPTLAEAASAVAAHVSQAQGASRQTEMPHAGAEQTMAEQTETERTEAGRPALAFPGRTPDAADDVRREPEAELEAERDAEAESKAEPGHAMVEPEQRSAASADQDERDRPAREDERDDDRDEDRHGG